VHRYIKVKIKKEQLTLLQLKVAITTLSNDLVGPSRKPYRITVRKLHPVEHELVTVGKLGNNIKFEVRSAEEHHNEAHFHITIRGQGSGSYKINDFSPLKSNIPITTEKKLLDWARENQQLLVDTWNEYHGHRITIA